MDIPWDQVIPAASVLAGAALGLLGSAWIERGRRKEERRRMLEQNRRDVRTAARLVARELAVSSSAFQYAEEEQTWWWEDLPTSAWSSYRPTLASVMTEDAWHLVASAYAELASAERYRRTKKPLTSVPPGTASSRSRT